MLTGSAVWGGSNVKLITVNPVKAKEIELMTFGPRRPARSAQANPRMTKIYQHVISIRASKEGMPHKCDKVCAAHHHLYEHKFENENACVFGLSDGSILIKSE